MQLALLEKQLPRSQEQDQHLNQYSSSRNRQKKMKQDVKIGRSKSLRIPLVQCVVDCLLRGQQTATAQLLLKQAHSPQKSEYQKATVKRKPSSATVFAEEEPKYRHEPTDQVCQGTPGLSPPLRLIEGNDFSQSPQAVTLHASNTAANLF